MVFANLAVTCGGALRRSLALGSGPDEKVASDFTSVPDPSARRWGGGRCGDGTGLFLQFEGVFDAGDLVEEGFVDLEALLYRVAGVDHRGVVAAANELANARGGHLGVLLSQIHGYLTHLYIVALAALAEC